LGNENKEFSVNNTSTKRIVIDQHIIHVGEDIKIGLGVVLNVIVESSLELLAVNINSEGIVQSNLILSGVFTFPDRLKKRKELSTFSGKESVGVVNNIFNGGVENSLGPEEDEVNVNLGLRVIVAKRKLERSTHVKPEEDTILEGFKSFKVNVIH
jgi:hypothetical protein